MNKILVLAAVVALASCGGSQEKLVKIKTTFGDMTVLLYDEAPLHKSNFIKLAESGEYDSTVFHRVIQGFMIQGGNLSGDLNEVEDEEKKIDAEIVEGLFHKKGELAAARLGDDINPKKQSSGSQFYIVQGRIWSEQELTTNQVMLNQALGQLFQTPEYDTLKDSFIQLQAAGQFEQMFQLAMRQKPLLEQKFDIDLSVEIAPERLAAYTSVGGVPHLDGEYTIFGRVVEGLEVIDRIASVPTNVDDTPVKPITVQMEIVKMPKTEVTEKYGYTYPKK